MTPTTPAPSQRLHFRLNAQQVSTDLPPGRLLLDYLRRDLRLVGTKEGCREGDCGACTVLLGARVAPGEVVYRAVPACMLLLGHVRGRHVVTIEGLNPERGLNAVQQAVVDHGGSQCGFCTPGFIQSFTGFLLNATEFSVEEATSAIAGNLCRCTGYVSLVRAGAAIAEQHADLAAPGPERLAALIESGVLPRHFGDAPAFLEQLADHEDTPVEGSPVVGGGTDLIVQRGAALDSLEPQFLLPLVAERAIEMEAQDLRIPGQATFEDLRRCELFTALWTGAKRDLERFASALIRERATVAGNIANASPIADGTAIFLALEARLLLECDGVQRQLPLADLFQGYKQLALARGERIVALLIRVPPDRTRSFHFEKVSKREYLDIASVNTALSLVHAGGVIQSATISAGGVAPYPLLLTETASFLVGKTLEAQTVLQAAERIDGEIKPISDVRGSEAYKRLLLRQLFFSHFLELFPERIDARELLEAAR